MNDRTHQELAGFIWRICNLLRGAYKRNEYRKVVLPLTVLRRFDYVMEDTKEAVRRANETSVNLPEEVRHTILRMSQSCTVQELGGNLAPGIDDWYQGVGYAQSQNALTNLEEASEMRYKDVLEGPRVVNRLQTAVGSQPMSTRTYMRSPEEP